MDYEHACTLCHHTLERVPRGDKTITILIFVNNTHAEPQADRTKPHAADAMSHFGSNQIEPVRTGSNRFDCG